MTASHVFGSLDILLGGRRRLIFLGISTRKLLVVLVGRWDDWLHGVGRIRILWDECLGRVRGLSIVLPRWMIALHDGGRMRGTSATEGKLRGYLIIC